MEKSSNRSDSLFNFTRVTPASILMIQRSEHLTRFLRAIERIAPQKLADSSWDNTGLIYEAIPNETREEKRNPFRILITNDLVYAVYEEAKKKNINLILTYHPVWFKAEKKLNMEMPLLTRMVTYCASSGISIFSPHTSLDAIEGGTNDYIFSLLGIENSNAIVKKTMEASGSINSLPSNSINNKECGNNPSSRIGYGRIATNLNMTIRDILSNLKKSLNLSYLRYSIPKNKNLDSKIDSIAVCVGSGGSILIGSGANVYITGELSHHDIIRAREIDNAIVILTEHSNCERPYLRNVLYKKLIEELKIEENDINGNSTTNCSFEVLISDSDRDPLEIYF